MRAVWARKLWTPQLDEDLDEQFRRMCLRESGAVLERFLSTRRRDGVSRLALRS